VTRAADRLESAEDLYENAPCGYLSTSPDGMIVRVNATFLRWTGHAHDQLVGVKRFQELLTAGGRIYHETHYAPMLRMQGSVREIAVDVVCADGRRLPVLMNSVVVRDEHGAARVVRTTVFDATERKLYEHELLAARNRERAARERVERLQRITVALAAAADAGDVAAAVIGELAPALGADRAAIVLIDPGTHRLEVVGSHGDVDLSELPDTLAGPEFEDGERAAIRLQLSTESQLEGRLWLGFASRRTFSDDERAFVAATASQTAVALERARLFGETREVAHALQRSLLGTPPPEDPRFDVASVYRPGIAGLEVGGDWHDVFTLPGGRVCVLVGDVVGRGLAAASAMGQLRSAVRAIAGAGHAPAAVLDHLDTFVEQVAAARYATVALAFVDADTGDVDFASAGHLPPVLDGDGDTRLFRDGASTPLGIPITGVPRPQGAFTLAPGGGFVLYTDGLVERRGEPIDTGIGRLVAAVDACADRSPARLIEDVPRALLEDAGQDDVCVLAFRRR
jgi:PAS domain S-box-containing protein